MPSGARHVRCGARPRYRPRYRPRRRALGIEDVVGRVSRARYRFGRRRFARERGAGRRVGGRGRGRRRRGAGRRGVRVAGGVVIDLGRGEQQANQEHQERGDRRQSASRGRGESHRSPSLREWKVSDAGGLCRVLLEGGYFRREMRGGAAGAFGTAGTLTAGAFCRGCWAGFRALLRESLVPVAAPPDPT